MSEWFLIMLGSWIIHNPKRRLQSLTSVLHHLAFLLLLFFSNPVTDWCIQQNFLWLLGHCPAPLPCKKSCELSTVLFHSSCPFPISLFFCLFTGNQPFHQSNSIPKMLLDAFHAVPALRHIITAAWITYFPCPIGCSCLLKHAIGKWIVVFYGFWRK